MIREALRERFLDTLGQLAGNAGNTRLPTEQEPARPAEQAAGE